MLKEKLFTLPQVARMLGEKYARVYYSVRVGEVISTNIIGEKYTFRLLTAEDVATLQELFADRDRGELT